MSSLGNRRFEMTASFGIGDTESTPFDVNGGTIVGIYIHGDWNDAAALRFQAKRDAEDAEWSDIIDAEGTNVELAAASGRYVAVPAGALHGLGLVRLKSTVAQDYAVDIYVTVRAFA